MMEALSLKMASMYGSNFANLVREVPPLRDGDTPTTRGNLSKLITHLILNRTYSSIHFSSKHLNHYSRLPKKNFYVSIFLVALARLWRENHGDADRNDERFQNAVKVYL
jgi:hypothetical protein